MDSQDINLNSVKPVLISAICSVVLCFLNFFFNINPFAIIIYIISAGFYFLYSAFSSADNSRNSDYLQSGEGSFSILLFIIGTRFFTDNIFILFPSIAFIILSTSIFIKKNFPQGAAGYILNPLAVLITCYLFYFDKKFSIDMFKKIITGLSEKNIETAILFSLIFLISFIFIFRYMPSAILISHGKILNEKSLKFQSAFNYFFIILKSLILLSFIYLTGIAGFAAYYIYRFSYNGKISISKIFYFIAIHLAVLFSLQFTDPVRITAAVILLAIISHFIYKLTRVNIYDRSIRYKL